MILTASSDLDAVNEILAAVGESPVNTLENPTNVDVISAIRILNRVNRMEQGRDWSFNLVPSLTLNPDVFTKKIKWADSYLRLRGANGEIYMKRGGQLFDFTNQTDKFEDSITVEAILLFPFDEMPEALRTYIIAKAAKEFQTSFLGDPNLYQELHMKEQEAWARLQEYEIDMTQPNLLQSQAVQTIRRR